MCDMPVRSAFASNLRSVPMLPATDPPRCFSVALKKLCKDTGLSSTPAS